ncbi:MAG: glycosyltransferase family 39 protein [Chloroflexi bacterium]|nr:glycosyltransferase family 39 protein [Chloroflexota bacterium]
MAGARFSTRDAFTLALRFAPQTALVMLALTTRLTLMSRSLDEVDVANFVNGLINGFDIPALRPHPPGYPVYMLAGMAINRALGDPLLSLTTLSAVSGSLAVIPFYSIVRSTVGRRWAFWSCLFLIMNPLYWAFSESALSDIPSAALSIVLAYASLRGVTSRSHLFLSAAVASLAIGVRLGNIPLLSLPGLTLVHVLIRERRAGLAALDMWVRIFVAVTGIWFVYMVFWGSDGTADYLAAFRKQWATAVTVYDIRSVAEPRLLNGLIRIERFFVGYYFTYPWLGLDERSRFGAWLSLPWITGFSLFLAAFRSKDFKHQIVAIWIGSIAYTAITIHFLPRYGLPHLPAYVACAVIGFKFFVTELPRVRRAPEGFLFIALSVTLFLYSVKSQPPIATFEMSPPEGSTIGGVLFLLGLGCALVARALIHRDRRITAIRNDSKLAELKRRALAAGLIMTALAALTAVVGYSRVAVLHASMSPSQQLVEYVRDNFDRKALVVCWDPVTHSTFEILMPGLLPVGYQSLDELRSSITGTRTLVATDQCVRYGAVSKVVNLKLVRTFEGNSPAWSKAPVLRLYASANRSEVGSPGPRD